MTRRIPFDLARHFGLLSLSTLILAASLGLARATDIQRVVSPGGIEAWLVEDYTNPLIAVDFAFKGGSVQDPDGKEGLARMTAGLLDEGAGDLEANAFQLRMEKTATRLSFSASSELFNGSLATLASRKEEAFDLLRLALSEPRFDEPAVERIRGQIKIGLRRAETDADRLAGRLLFANLYPDHPYGRPSRGTPESIDAIGVTDLAAYHRDILVRDTLKIAVVGAIDADSLKTMLDEVFGALPQSGTLKTVQDIAPVTDDVFKVTDIDVPQSSLLFAMPGLKRDDPDFITAFVVNHIFGGGGFSSRLYEEVREKRGLVYSVYSFLSPYDHSALLMAGAGTQNARVGESLNVIRTEIARMGAQGPSAEDLAKAKRFLIGAFPLRFDTSDKIAAQLVHMQVAQLGIDYIEKRNGLIEAVTLKDAKRVAAKLYDPEKLAVVIAGKPVGDIAEPTGG